MSIMEANHSAAVIAVNVTMKQENKNDKTSLTIGGGGRETPPQPHSCLRTYFVSTRVSIYVCLIQEASLSVKFTFPSNPSKALLMKL